MHSYDFLTVAITNSDFHCHLGAESSVRLEARFDTQKLNRLLDGQNITAFK